MAERPVKVDPADGPCPVCEERTFDKDGTCDDCHEEKGLYMGATTDHFHLDKLADKVYWRPIGRNLCKDCYLADYAKAFPDAKLPAI